MINYTKTAFFVFLLVLSVSLVSAHGASLEEVDKLVASNVTCDMLDDEQLEAIGEHYMEQMHPGESHELMHKMMGLTEGTEAEEQFHINMARVLHCGESRGMMGGGMMNMMGGNMMMGNMMGGQIPQTGMMQGMMGGSMMGYGWNVFSILYLILLVGLIILTWLGILKLWQTIKK